MAYHHMAYDHERERGRERWAERGGQRERGREREGVSERHYPGLSAAILKDRWLMTHDSSIESSHVIEAFIEALDAIDASIEALHAIETFIGTRHSLALIEAFHMMETLHVMQPLSPYAPRTIHILV